MGGPRGQAYGDAGGAAWRALRNRRGHAGRCTVQKVIAAAAFSAPHGVLTSAARSSTPRQRVIAPAQP
jgi:hypothetical protein